MTKKLGAIYTPRGHAKMLAKWAIQSKKDIVLDMGTGPGVFVFQSYDRLIELGATKRQATDALYGSEIDKKVFEAFTNTAKEKDLVFKNIHNINFFKETFPHLDAVIGNPPYVRRRGMGEKYLNLIRSKTLKQIPEIASTELSNLSDLYIYFLLFVLPHLKPGGRLATIVADTWLNARYGSILKSYLLKEFNINQIVSLDRSVFDNADVKAVLLLATKKSPNDVNDTTIRFSRVRNGLSIKDLSTFIEKKNVSSNKDILVKEIDKNSLDIYKPWGAIFKTTALFDQLSQKSIIKPINFIADVRIGMETLARDFFVIPAEEKRKGKIESRFLKPFIYSVHDYKRPKIKKGTKSVYYLFYCDASKKDLVGTKALTHIKRGESLEVTIRGTSTTVIGYHKKERIIKAKRPRWYDLKSEYKKKAIAQILLPRFIFKDFPVVWNVAQYIPGGTIIQFFPKETDEKMDIKIYLSILTSSLTEIIFRTNAQVYGGGTSNLNISVVKHSPTIDVNQLTLAQKTSLVTAYNHFLKTKNKSKIDKLIYKILDLNKDQIIEMNDLLIELRHITQVAKMAAHPAQQLLKNKK